MATGTGTRPARSRHIPARNRNRADDRARLMRNPGSRRVVHAISRVLIWSALGWTVAVTVIMIFYLDFGYEQSVFERMGAGVLALGLIPIAVVALPLVGVVARRIRPITSIAALLTGVMVMVLLVSGAGGLMIPAAFSLLAAALLELAEGD